MLSQASTTPSFNLCLFQKVSSISGRLTPALSPQACLGERCIKSESGNKAIEVGVIPADKAEEALRIKWSGIQIFLGVDYRCIHITSPKSDADGSPEYPAARLHCAAVRAT